MRILTGLRRSLAIAFCGVALMIPTYWQAQADADMLDKAIATRQGFMKLVVWEAGPLFGMAKGDMAYDAGSATLHANNLKTLSLYPVEALFMPGTAISDRPGKTRAKADIWSDMGKYNAAFDAWRSAVDAVAAVAGAGQPALAEAVGGLGKSCGGCHKPFRAEEF